MKKVLITGGCGFIGSHLAEMLASKNIKVVVFDKYNINNHYGNLEKSISLSKIKIKLGDIRDFDSVIDAVSGCDTIFHLAALIGIPYSYVSPLAYIRTNVEGTFNVLESSKNSKLDQILITSTSETYGSAKYIPMDENHPKNPTTTYAAGKLSADQAVLSYFKMFNL